MWCGVGLHSWADEIVSINRFSDKNVQFPIWKKNVPRHFVKRPKNVFILPYFKIENTSCFYIFWGWNFRTLFIRKKRKHKKKWKFFVKRICYAFTLEACSATGESKHKSLFPETFPWRKKPCLPPQNKKGGKTDIPLHYEPGTGFRISFEMDSAVYWGWILSVDSLLVAQTSVVDRTQEGYHPKDQGNLLFRRNLYFFPEKSVDTKNLYSGSLFKTEF